MSKKNIDYLNIRLREFLLYTCQQIEKDISYFDLIFKEIYEEYYNLELNTLNEKDLTLVNFSIKSFSYGYRLILTYSIKNIKDKCTITLKILNNQNIELHSVK